MRPEDIIRSWKDESYQYGLDANAHALLPDNPAGLIELTDTDLNEIHGGSLITVCSYLPCESLITYCLTAITFCIPTWGLCPILNEA